MEWKPGVMDCATCACIPCRCIKCEQCGKRVAPIRICTSCYKCRVHHSVYAPKDFPQRGCTYKHEIDNATYEMNPLRRHLGLELEMSKYGYIPTHEPQLKDCRYQMVHDGSVRGSGQELVTTKMIGDGYLFGTSQLCNMVNDAHCEVNESCGFHVHVDAGEYSPFDLRRSAVLFTMIQNSLYGPLVDKDRQHSDWGKIYCPPLKLKTAYLMGLDDKNEIIDFFHSWLYGTTMPKREDHKMLTDAQFKDTLRKIDQQLRKYKGTKYMNEARRWALNFHSWMMRGTLEFRLKEGTTNSEDILMWPLWCGWFTEMASKITDKEVMYMLKSPPVLVEFTRTMEEYGMPNYVTTWVEGRCK